MAEQARIMMERQVEHMKRMIGDLLDVSRLRKGAIKLQSERIDVVRLAQVVVEDYRLRAEASGLTLSVQAPPMPLWVCGDSARLTQVLANLLDNAIKFTGRGGTITVGAHADVAGPWAVLTVRDTGVGISPELLPRLFDPFSQADQPIDRPHGGLGLGLALIKGLVELHGGRIEAASAGLGQGAQLTLRLPFAEGPCAQAAGPTQADAAVPSLRVLVIEDNRDAADSLRILLELRGCEVQVAYTGPDGVRAAQQWRPEVILCDIGLPGLDGYGVAREVQRSKATARARLIAITGYGQEQDRIRSRHAGFSLHLTKPVDPEVLWQALARPGA
jgi:CheY-like chemotaxis protein